MNWKNFAIVIGIVTGSMTASVGIWKGLDRLGLRPVVNGEFEAKAEEYMGQYTQLAQVVDQLNQYVVFQQYQYLKTKHESVGLTVQEQVELCKAAELLGLFEEGCL